MIAELDTRRIDWSDLESASVASQELLRELAADKQRLRSLALAVEHRPELMSLCERHRLVHYIVIHDDIEGIGRLRLHMFTDEFRDRPHDHRFSFTSLLLTGSYRHTVFGNVSALFAAVEDDAARPWIDEWHADPNLKVQLTDVPPLMSRVEHAGVTYTLHHSVVHSTAPAEPGTVSLMLRGPAEKRRSVNVDRETLTAWWRFGQQDETEAFKAQKRMTLEQYRAFIEQLEEKGII